MEGKKIAAGDPRIKKAQDFLCGGSFRPDLADTTCESTVAGQIDTALQSLPDINQQDVFFDLLQQMYGSAYVSCQKSENLPPKGAKLPQVRAHIACTSAFVNQPTHPRGFTWAGKTRSSEAIQDYIVPYVQGKVPITAQSVIIPTALQAELTKLNTYPNAVREIERLFREAVGQVKDPAERPLAAFRIAGQMVDKAKAAAVLLTTPAMQQTTEDALAATYVFNVGDKASNYAAQFEGLPAELLDSTRLGCAAGAIQPFARTALRITFADAVRKYREVKDVDAALADPAAKAAKLAELANAVAAAIKDAKLTTDIAQLPFALMGLEVNGVDVDATTKSPTKVTLGDRTLGVPPTLIAATGAQGNLMMKTALAALWARVLANDAVKGVTDAAQRSQLLQGLADDLATKLSGKGPFEVMMSGVAAVDVNTKAVALTAVPAALVGTAGSIHGYNTQNNIDERAALDAVRKLVDLYNSYSKAAAAQNLSLDANTLAQRLQVAVTKIYQDHVSDGQGTRVFLNSNFDSINDEGQPVLKEAPAVSGNEAIVTDGTDTHALKGFAAVNYLDAEGEEHDGVGFGIGAYYFYSHKFADELTLGASAGVLHILGPGVVNIQGVGDNNIRTTGEVAAINATRVDRAQVDASGKIALGASAQLKYSVGVGPVVSTRPFDAADDAAFDNAHDPANGVPEVTNSSRGGILKGQVDINGLTKVEDEDRTTVGGFVGGLVGTATGAVSYDAKANDGQGKGVFKFEGKTMAWWLGGRADFLAMAGRPDSLTLTGAYSHMAGSGDSEAPDGKPIADAYKAELHTVSGSLRYDNAKAFSDSVGLGIGGGGRVNWIDPADKFRWGAALALDVPISLDGGRTLTPLVRVSYSDISWQGKTSHNTQPAETSSTLASCDEFTCEEGTEADYVEGSNPEKSEDVPETITMGDRSWNVTFALPYRLNKYMVLDGGLSLVWSTNHEVTTWDLQLVPFLGVSGGL